MITLDSKGANEEKATDIDKSSLAALARIADAKGFSLPKDYGKTLETARTISNFGQSIFYINKTYDFARGPCKSVPLQTDEVCHDNIDSNL